MRATYAVVVALAFLGAGCSANTFKDTISNFDSGVGNVQQTAQLYTTEFETIAVKLNVQSAAANKAAITYDRQNCRIITTKLPAGSAPSTKCALSDSSGKLLPDTSSDAKLFADLAVLKTYSSNLMAVVNATTVDDLNKAESSLVSGLKNVGTDLRPPPPPGVKAPTSGPLFATQVGLVGPILQPILDEYIEHLRIDILRDAVDQADPLIQRYAASVQVLLGTLQQRIIGSKVQYVDNEVRDYNIITNVSVPANITAQSALQDARQENEDVRTLIQPEADLSAAVAKMAAAHATLKKDLDNPDSGVDLSSKSVYAFASQAAAALTSAIQLELKK
jgi:DNA-binding transcriptional regulator of glucitol operon